MQSYDGWLSDYDSVADWRNLRSFPARHQSRLLLVVVEALLAGEGQVTVLAEDILTVVGTAAGLLAARAGLVADVTSLVVVSLAAEVAGLGAAEVGRQARNNREVVVVQVQVQSPETLLAVVNFPLAVGFGPDFEAVLRE